MSREYKADFMIVGAQKCGTTTLSKMLSSHPSVVCCDEKEPMFFSSATNWESEISDYHSLYQWQEGALHFEASTSYTMYPHSNLDIWEDLYAYNPDLKIIYLVRNPIDRIISGYMHSYERGYIDLDIETALVENPILLNISRYATQIKPFIDRFGADQVQILFFKDLIKDEVSIINQLSDFLGISPNGFQDLNDVHANKSIGGFKKHHKYDDPGFMLSIVQQYFPPLWKLIIDNSARSFKEKPSLPAKIQRMILHLLRSEIDELEKITGRNLNKWREIKQVANTRADYHLNWYEAKVKLLERIRSKVKREFLS